MPFFKKWSCCRQNVENQVEATSTSNHQPKFDKNDEQFKSDLQAVQWMRDRSKQASKEDEEEEEKEEEGSDKENDSSLAPVSLMKRHSSFSPSTRSPIDTDAFMDAQKPLSTQDEEEMNELTPVSRVSITPPSTNSNNDDENDSTDSNVEETTKLRYGKAVKLLHRSMLEKQKSLTSGEREFLHDLLDEECSVRMDAVEKRVEALESAAQTLEENELFEVDAPPSPSQTLQHYSPPRRPMCRGIKLSVVRPAESCGEAFELSIRSSSYMNDDDFDDRDFDDTPLLVIEDEPPPQELQESAPPRDSSLVPMQYDDSDAESMEEDINKMSTFPFYILGQSSETRPNVLTPDILEALRGFLPFVVSEDNFYLKYSLIRDGASLTTLLHSCRASKFTIIGVETMDGEVFGSFTGSPWRSSRRKEWYGTGESFLWRLKQSRNASSSPGHSELHQMEVYPYTGMDDQIQCCTDTFLAIGGGDWRHQDCPYANEPRGIGLLLDNNLETGETNSSATFCNPRLCHRTKLQNTFEIANVEVWTLTPCVSLEEANKLELHKLFVEEQRV